MVFWEAKTYRGNSIQSLASNLVMRENDTILVCENMKMINKEQFLKTLSCPTYGWLLKHVPMEESLSHAEQLRLEEGLEVQQRARGLFPQGVMVTGNNEACVRKTKKLLSDRKTMVIFEATFTYEDFIAKADILIKDGSHWRLVEAKSKVNDDEELLDDLSYTVFVAQSAGLPISSCSLLLVNKNYRLGMSDESLFMEIDHTNDALARAAEFRKLSDGIAQTLASVQTPVTELKWKCKGCDIFEECCGKGVENHIFDLPRLSHTKFCQLNDKGVVSIENIPDNFKLTDGQVRVRQAVATGEPVVDVDGLKDALNSIVFPVYHLDFETTQTCLPLYEGIPPYGKIPTQYSIHICDESGVVGHREYLADPSQNCTRILAENLIRDCGSEGSIVTYTNFEKTIINGLAGSFPVLREELTGLIERLVDLCEIIRRSYYHPGFRGSFSIKEVLPVVVPDMGYEGMEVDNGMDASALFANMARGKYDAEEVNRIRANLLSYCGLDTMAMVKVMEGLRGRTDKK